MIWLFRDIAFHRKIGFSIQFNLKLTLVMMFLYYLGHNLGGLTRKANDTTTICLTKPRKRRSLVE